MRTIIVDDQGELTIASEEYSLELHRLAEQSCEPDHWGTHLLKVKKTSWPGFFYWAVCYRNGIQSQCWPHYAVQLTRREFVKIRAEMHEYNSPPSGVYQEDVKMPGTYRVGQRFARLTTMVEIYTGYPCKFSTMMKEAGIMPTP